VYSLIFIIFVLNSRLFGIDGSYFATVKLLTYCTSCFQWTSFVFPAFRQGFKSNTIFFTVQVLFSKTFLFSVLRFGRASKVILFFVSCKKNFMLKNFFFVSEISLLVILNFSSGRAFKSNTFFYSMQVLFLFLAFLFSCHSSKNIFRKTVIFYNRV